MRIISGIARGRRLKEPNGKNTRPTTDKVKESLFSAIQFEIKDADVLDLFAGTGQLGLEAISRGAHSCIFTDISREAVQLIKQNISLCSFEKQSQVFNTSFERYLEKASKADIIFLDPPYASDYLEKALNLIIQFDILNPDGIIICESASDFKISVPDKLKVRREYIYGTIKLTILDLL